MTIGDVIMKKLQADSLMTSKNSVSDTEMRNYITQYRETDFNFVSRLAEHAGIYYYFTHTNGAHEMVLLNKAGDHKPTPNLAELRMVGAGTKLGTLDSLRAGLRGAAGRVLHRRLQLRQAQHPARGGQLQPGVARQRGLRDLRPPDRRVDRRRSPPPTPRSAPRNSPAATRWCAARAPSAASRSASR